MSHTAGAPTRDWRCVSAERLQPLSVQRLPKARFRVIVHDADRAGPDTGDRERDLEAGVRKVNAFMEARILRAGRRMVLGPQALAETRPTRSWPRGVFNSLSPLREKEGTYVVSKTAWEG